MSLSKQEIEKRLQDLRNMEMLHGKARDRVKNLEEENKKLKERIKDLEEENILLKEKLQGIGFELEQVKIKLFGKKPEGNRLREEKEKIARDIFSYQRPIPENITKTEKYPQKKCLRCGETLIKKEKKVFFEEDIPLPTERIVVKREVETGYCPSCRRQSSGFPIPPKKVVLGEKVKKYICVLSVANRLSHAQIEDHLKDAFKFHVSRGEIGNILKEEADNLRPEYQKLEESVISQKGTHYDETSWRVQKEEQGKFAWVALGTERNDAVFSLGRSRGKGNVEKTGIPNLGISDDYGVYRNIFPNHQLCFAHPLRKLRDLGESMEFGKRKKRLILKTYELFRDLYQRIRNSLSKEISPYLKRKWRKIFDEISSPRNLDPSPLLRIKKSLRKNKEKYFTFLRYPGIPIDNNKAERALRHLVIKRKISLGSNTQRGAETLGILASVILSLKWNNPKDWFLKYLALKP